MHDKIGDQSTAFGKMVSSLDRIEGLLKDQSTKMESIDSSVKGLDSTLTKVKERVIGASLVLGGVVAVVTYFFGQRLSEIVKAIMALH